MQLVASIFLLFAAIISGDPFTITGRVVSVCTSEKCSTIYLYRQNLGKLDYFYDDINLRCRSGDVVEIVGIDRKRDGVDHYYVVNNVHVLRHINLSENAALPNAEFLTAKDEGAMLALDGVITSVVTDDVDANWNWITLRTKYGNIFAPTPANEHSLNELLKLIDAKVRLRGIAYSDAMHRNADDMRIRIFGNDGISVLKPANNDPFAAPLLSSGVTDNHRRRIVGKLLCRGNHRIFVLTESGAVVQARLHQGRIAAQPGDEVEVVGFPVADAVRLQLTEALVRGTGKKSSLATKNVDYTKGKRVIGGEAYQDIHGRQVTVEGKVASVSETTIELLADDAGCSLNLDVSALKVSEIGLTPGMSIKVTGIAAAEFESFSGDILFPRYRGLTVIPAAIDAIVILKRPSPFTTTRLVVVIALLLAAIIAIFIWNRSLEATARKRGRMLFKAEIEHDRARQKVEERTRLAIELHDAISQTLTGIALQIDTAEAANPNRNDLTGKSLDLAKRMIASCRQELRGCLWDLRSRTFEEKDLSEAINRTIAPYLGDTRAIVRFNVPRGNLPDTTIHAILKIIRELATNAIRHGKAKNIRIAGESHDDTISFSVKDDGCGFDPAKLAGASEGHFGLLGINERLHAFNGKIQMDSTPGGGASFVVTMKLDHRSAR